MLAYTVADQNGKWVVVTLEIPEDAITNINRSNIAVPETALYRTNKAKVLTIEGKKGFQYKVAESFRDGAKNPYYVVGEIVEEPSFHAGLDEDCDEGIQFFLSRRVAEVYAIQEIKNGLSEFWYSNGQKCFEQPMKAGKRDGLRRCWWPNGQKMTEWNYLADKKHGIWQKWHDNGVLEEISHYKDDKKHGACLVWHKNGTLATDSLYKDGRCVEAKSWDCVGKLLPHKT